MGRQQAMVEIYPRNLERLVAGLRDARCEWRQGHDRHAEQGIEFPSRRVLDRKSVV